MKKLLTMIVTATAIAFGVKTAAADSISSVNFDGLTAETEYNALYADDQDSETGGPFYWVDASLAQFLTSTVIGTVKAYSEPSPASNTNYLELDTDAVVYRRAKADGAGTTMGQIYVDTLVQFTPSDEDAECAINEGDKIAIWMREANIDAADPELTPPATNLLVHAGGTSGATDYVIAGNWKAGQWYRLVIKSSTTAANGNPGFVIFIDGNKVKDVNDVEVFPSLVTTGVNVNTIAALGFNGTGAIDQLAFTTDDPCPEVKPFTIEWDSNVTALEITYTDGDTGLTVVSNLTDVAGGTETVLLPPTGGTVGVTYTLATGYGFRSTASNCSYANGTVTVAANAIEPTFTITPYSENFFVGNESFDTFAAALAAATQSGGAIRLGKAVTVDPAWGGDYPGSIVVSTGTVIIDLAGQTITGDYDDDADYTATIINFGANLIITNSTSQAGSVVGADFGGGEYGDSLLIITGDTTIYGGKFENFVDVDSNYADDFVIYGGSFADNGDSSAFDFEDNIAADLEATYDDPYWTVGAPAEYTVTLPAAPEHTTWSVTVNGAPASGSGNVYTAGEGASVTATLSVAEGYLFSDGTTSKEYSFEDIDSDINATSLIELPTVATPKAKNGTTLYLTLQDAIDDAAAGDTVEVLASDTLAARLNVAAGQDITLDLGGYTLTATGDAICNRGSIVITNGTITAAGNVAYNRGNGASIVVEDGTYTSTADIAFAVYGATNSTITVNGGTITAQEFCVGNYHPAKATTITINDGTLTSIDNAVVGTNGTAGDGDNEIYINGGTLNGGITTAGYVACGIYLPNDDTLEMTGGTINVTGGCGILARAGQVSVTGGEINTTGNTVGKVGDSRVVVPCSAIVFDTDANYPGYDSATAEFEVSGGTFSSEVACVAQVNENGGDVAIAVSGGTFDQPIDPKYCAEDYIPADDGEGNYSVTFGYEISYVTAYGDAPATKYVSVATLGGAYTLLAADLPALEAAGHVFNGWGKTAGETISADTVLTASWSDAAPETYDVTLPAAPTHTSWTVTINGEPAVGVNNVYTASAGDTVVVKLTADSGYLFNDGTSEKTLYTFDGIAADQDKSGDSTPAVDGAKAKIGTFLYLTLQDAVDTVPQGGVSATTVEVLCDQTLASKLVVSNQMVDFEAEAPVTITGQLRVVDGASCVIGENVTLVSASHPTLFILGDPKVGTEGVNGPSSLVVSGTVANVCATFDQTFTISGNGTDHLGASITIGETGVVSNLNGIAIYKAFPGALTVDGTVEGASAISIKDGTLTVNDGATITATLASGAAYVGNNNGESPTGDAIIAPYYPAANGYGTPVVAVNGGTITVADTANCAGIEAYDFNGVQAPEDAASNVNVAGGTFNTPVAGDYCAEGYVPEDLGGGSYGVDYGYQIAYVSDYGTAPAAKYVTVATLGGAYTLLAADLPALEAEGYTFNGWGKTAGETISADTVLTAQWTEAPVAVVLNLEGSGTAVDPYLITNLADLQNFRDWVNDGNTGAGKYFKVTAASIDLASESPWTPIGSKEDNKYFAGEFDGNGVVINNLSLAASPDYGGFFSAVSDGAVLKSFTLGASTITGLANAAAVCAYKAPGGTAIFSNIVNNVSITGSKKLGGFICQANGGVSFIDCVNNGTITCTALTDGKLAGGFIAMYNHGENLKASFLRCVNNGSIGSAGQSAGFIAYNQTTLALGGNELNCCTNYGTITAQLSAGGFLSKGGNSNTMNGDYTFTDCAQLGTLTCGNAYNIESSISGANGTHNAYGKTTILSAYGIINHNGIQGKKGWLWKAKIVGATYTTLYSDLATAVADASGETLVIAADSTLSNSFDIDGTVTIGAGIAVSGGNLRINSGTLAITGGTFTDVALAEAGTGEITITGGTFDADPSDFVADGYEAVEEGGLYTVQLATPPAGKWDDVEENSIAGLTSENKEAVEATLDKLETALGSVSDVEDWISTVYGSADVPAAKLAATTDALIAISLAYDLPILEEEPEVTVETTTTTSGKAAFLFTFTDDGDPISVQAEKALQLIKYSATVNGEFAYTPAKFAVTAVESVNGNVLKAEFVGNDAAGYGKVDFTVPQN